MGLVSLGTLLLHVPFNIVLCMLVVLTFSTSRMIREHCKLAAHHRPFGAAVAAIGEGGGGSIPGKLT